MQERLISYYVREYQNGSPHLEPKARNAAAKYVEAIRELDDVTHRTYEPGTKIPDGLTDEQALERAIASFGSGFPIRGVNWGVRKVNLPAPNVSLGEYVTVTYSSIGTPAKIGGFVAHVQMFPTGKAMVIRLRDSWNSMNPHGGWRFLSLWMPHGAAMAGFL